MVVLAKWGSNANYLFCCCGGGPQVTDVIIVLNSTAALHAFASRAQVRMRNG